MRYIILAALVTGCSCQTFNQQQFVRQYKSEKITVKRQMCKKSYVFLTKCETITETKGVDAQSGQDVKAKN